FVFGKDQKIIKGGGKLGAYETGEKPVKNKKADKKSAKEKLNRIILVTSAFHMPRAKSLFEKQGLEVQAFPVDFKIEANNRTILDFLPSARAMKDDEFSIR
ncbi:MAG: hypothetical protein RL604_1500, partial [Pseudomonadota bacterium]